MLVLLTCLAVLVVLHLARGLLVPVVAAAMLAFLLRPAVRLLEHCRIPALIGSLLMVAVVITLPVVIMAQVGPAALHWIDRAPEVAQRIEALAKTASSPLERFSRVTREVDRLTEVGDQRWMAIPVEVTGQTAGRAVVARAGSWMLSAGAGALLLYFMLVYGEEALRRAVAAMRSRRHRRLVGVMLHRLEFDFGRYLATISVINLVLGVAVTIAMFLCGMPSPLLWGGLATVLNFVPYIGALTGIAIVTLVSLLSFDTGLMVLTPPLVYASLTTLEGYLVTPMILGFRFHLNPLVVLLAITVWAWLWGVAGALLAVPLLVVAQLALARVQFVRPLLCAMGDAPVPQRVIRSPEAERRARASVVRSPASSSRQ